MPLTIVSRTNRILKNMNCYKMKNEITSDELPNNLNLKENEFIIGLYFDSESNRGKILFTNFGLYIIDTFNDCFVNFLEIKDELSPESKEDVISGKIKGLNLELKNNSKIWLPVTAVSKNGGYDLYEFIRYFMRVRGDLSKYPKEEYLMKK